MTSQVLRTLERRGYIQRLSHPSDTRAFSLVITTEGREKVDQGLLVVEKVDHDFFSTLESSKSFAADLRKLLAKRELTVTSL